MPVDTLHWSENGLDIIDQRLLPVEEKRMLLTTVEDVAEAIETLAVRGAPAIGVAAAYGVVVAAMKASGRTEVESAIARLRATRPTAVNLFYALDSMASALDEAYDSGDATGFLLNHARKLHDEDLTICRDLSHHGATLIEDGFTVLTHCNAGGLATSGYGTALGVVYAALETGKKVSVYSDETRPLLQGSRLSAWELGKNGVPVTVICDNMAAAVMKQGRIDCVIVGADRIAANGDTANKIGTYGLSIIAREHNIPFYVAAPLTSFDFSLSSGDEIPIEERKSEELHSPFGRRIAPEGVSFYNPAFDVTPSEYITAIISEKGVARHPFTSSLKEWI